MENDLISRSALKKFIQDGLNCKDPAKAFGHDAIEILTEIEYAPAADAVEVVRCKDCEHFFSEVCRHGFALNYCRGDEFCSYGERRVDDARDQ